MSKNALQKILVVLAGLVVVYGIIRLATGGGPELRPGAIELAAVLEGVDDQTLQAVRLVGPEQEIELARSPNGWTANGFEADSAAIARMFSALADVEVGSMVAANSANHERLDVAGHEAWTIELGLGGDDSRSFILGSVGTMFQTAYARLLDQDEVYTVRGDMRGALTRTIVDWRDKIITRVDTASVQTIVVERDGESVTVERADSTWTLGSGEAANATNVNLLIRELRDLRASGFTDEGSVFPTEDVPRLVVLDASQDTLTALEVTEVNSVYWVTARGTDILFHLPSFRAARIVPELEDLREEEGS